MNPSETPSEDFVHPGENFVKVLFYIEQDEDGYPPDTCESMWAQKTEQGYILENIPFFAYGVSCHDIIAAEMVHGMLEFREVVWDSRHSTIRLIIYDEDMVPTIREQLRELGCDSERSHLPKLIAVDIPPTVDIPTVRSYLQEGFDAEIFDYEEAAVIW